MFRSRLIPGALGVIILAIIMLVAFQKQPSALELLTPQVDPKGLSTQ